MTGSDRYAFSGQRADRGQWSPPKFNFARAIQYRADGAVKSAIAEQKSSSRSGKPRAILMPC
jgi:hypothetical protein